MVISSQVNISRILRYSLGYYPYLESVHLLRGVRRFQEDVYGKEKMG